jgi:hypothetical protein
MVRLYPFINFTAMKSQFDITLESSGSTLPHAPAQMSTPVTKVSRFESRQGIVPLISLPTAAWSTNSFASRPDSILVELLFLTQSGFIAWSVIS